LPADYFADAGEQKVVSAVHVETCVGQAPGGAPVDFLDESVWINSLGLTIPFKIVAYAHLARDDTAEVLAAQAAIPNVVGIRMIMNHHPEDESLTWPQVEHGDYFTDEKFRAGFAKLQDFGFSFDLHLNPHQMLEAAAFFADFPGVPVILDHLGCLKLGGTEAEDAESLATWRAGIDALAALPHVNVKISMFPYILKDCFTNPASEAIVRSLVFEVIGKFGPSRCMVASNFPVDKLFGVPLQLDHLYATMQKWFQDLPEADQKLVFKGTAERVYKLAAPAAAAAPETA